MRTAFAAATGQGCRWLRRSVGRMTDDWDVIVVGAGAAGLLAAIRAAERGRRVLLLEKNRKPGVKILMSGGTRCNITQSTDRRGIVDAFGEQGPFLQSALAALPPPEVVRLFEEEGVATKVERTGKIFPKSDQAIDVQRALLRRLQRSSATLATEEPAVTLEKDGNRIRVRTHRRSLQAASVIVTCGGASYPGCGTRGDGYEWARAFGHAVVPPRPALVPLMVADRWVPELAGVTVPSVEVQAPALTPQTARRGRRSDAARSRDRGSLLFTHHGLSGPAVLNVSRCFTLSQRPLPQTLYCSFLPGWNEEQLNRHLQEETQENSRRGVASVLAQRLPRRLAETLLGVGGLPAGHRLAELSRSQRRGLVQACIRAPCRVTGTLGLKKAEVTTGGVALDEVDSSTMRSKRIGGLYFAGEILDLDGPIGGYNFQAAFSTGWLAGGQV